VRRTIIEQTCWRSRRDATSHHSLIQRSKIQSAESLSEFTFDLRHPNPKYLNAAATPLIERNPTLFWKCTTAILVCALLASQHGARR
jgi:hypothetical protein